jgi:hemicentin
VFVAVAPEIEEQQQEFVVLQEREVMLPCRASGLPPPRVTWRKDGVPIAPTDFRFRVTRSGWLAIAIAR